MDPTLTAIGGTLAGAAFGAGLTWLISKSVAKEEREHQETELIQQRREAAAIALNSELERVDESLPKPATPSAQGLAQLLEAASLMPRCQKRAEMIEDAGIAQRLYALNSALWTAVDDAEEKEEQGRSVNIWSLRIAVSDLYAAIIAYQLRKQPPAPRFLTPDEVMELTAGEPGGMERINRAVRHSAARKYRAGE
jgi:hypothetical protein